MKIAKIFILIFWVESFSFPTPKTMPVQRPSTHLENRVSSGKILFEQNCAKCHGTDGTKGRFGAKNLQTSTLSDEQYFKVIQKGKGIMPSWEKRLTSDRITEIISYIKTLKK